MDLEIHPEARQLLFQIDDLRQQTSQLLEQEAYLKNHRQPLLFAKYEQEIGTFEYALLKIRVAVNEFKFRIERLTAIMNHGRSISPEDLAKLEQEVHAMKEKWHKEIKEKERMLNASVSFLNTVSFLSKQETETLKRLYRKLCRLLHPDLNQFSDAHTLYWSSVQDAYVKGDINKLEALLVAVHNHEELNDLDGSAGIEALKKERNRLESVVLEYTQRVKSIETTPPLCLQKELYDPEWIKTKQRELTEVTDAMAVRRDALRKMYNELCSMTGSRVQ